MAYRLTDCEYEIMELLWASDEPLSRSDILMLTEGKRSWKVNSFHSLVNSMLKKGAIEVVHFTKTSLRNYGRTFRAIISPEDYIVMQLKQSATFSEPGSAAGLVSALVNDTDLIDDKTIDELEEMIKRRREMLD